MHYLFYFKQVNNNVNNFSNPSSFDIHYTLMDIDLESFNYMKQKKISEVAVSKKFQNEFSKLSKKRSRISKIKIFIL